MEMEDRTTSATVEEERTVSKALDAHQKRVKIYKLFQQYYDGHQNVKMTARLKKFLAQQGVFKANYTGLVVDALVDRLKVTGFRTDSDDLTRWLDAVWRNSRMDEEAILIHAQAAIKGDSYVIVDYDEVPRINYNDALTTSIFYEAEDRKTPILALKVWEVEHGKRLNLYYPDRIEKYYGDQGRWRKYNDDGDAGWPIPWPIGEIPVFHFRNKPAAGAFGQSEIANIVPLQDAINKSLIDLFQAMDSNGFPRTWVTGAEQPVGGWKFSIGDVWHFINAEAKTGTYSAPNISPMILVIEELTNMVAAISKTPRHLFRLSGDYPSGEALKTAEAGLVSKVENRQTIYGNTYEDVLRHCILQQGYFGKKDKHDASKNIDVIWESAETRSEKADAEITAILDDMLSEQEQLRRNGYNQADIDRIIEEKAENRKGGLNLGAELLKSFERGPV